MDQWAQHAAARHAGAPRQPTHQESLVPREACPRILRRCATALVSGTVALTLAASPSMAQASQPLLPAASISTGMPTTGMKLRTIMSLQDPTDDVAAAPEGEATGPVAEGPPPVAAAPAPAPTSPEPSKGLGLMITGAVMTGAVGLPLTFYGIYGIILFNRAERAAADSGTEDFRNLGRGAALGLTVFGLIIVSAGAPMLGVGAYKFSKWRKWKNEGHALLPMMNRTAHGTWTAGVGLRF
jgi:hypothetical protein